MYKKKLLIFTLFLAGSLNAGSDSGLSNRFSLGKANKVIKSGNDNYNQTFLHILLIRKNGKFIFYCEKPQKDIIAGIYSLNGCKIAEPVLLKPGKWCWTPLSQTGKKFGAGFYLAVFKNGKTRMSIPFIFEQL
ncbi:MAG: hypothetical protein GXY77_09075 [Fibrobacter sp.]|nr:hypothetical protein [Fibrobacter sp.]